MNLTKKFLCPVGDEDCPYWSEGDICNISDPMVECDDAAFAYGEDDKSPFVWEDEKGKLYNERELLEMGYHFVNDMPVKSLADEVARIKSKWADIASVTMTGKTCAEVVKDILEGE